MKKVIQLMKLWFKCLVPLMVYEKFETSGEQRWWKKGKSVPRTAADFIWQSKKKEELTTWQMDTILLVFSVAFLPAGICVLFSFDLCSCEIFLFIVIKTV